ncbi:hypothetical protein [Verrucomicrobium sp. BvORR106]|uniref:hypothetical protein n=1 Tax=Verrucomicrobium sp. BvORR106 TaxID=1403819 RepID=UPI002240F541|nr:hypothetical protein [Verrucomicrobium sp. BvORR106]
MKIFAVSALLLVIVPVAADALGAGPFISIGVGIEIIFKLCAGWIAFLTRTAPKMEVNYLLIANGLLGLLLGVAALQWVMRALIQSNSPASCPWRWKWTIAVTSMFALLFGICVSAVGIATHSASLFQEPVVKTHPSRSTIHKDVTNAKQLYVEAIVAHDAGNSAPGDTWAALAASTDLEPKELNMLAVVRSLSTEEPPEVWTYLEIISPDDPEMDIPVFLAPRAHAPGEIIMGFAHGKAQVCTLDEYDDAIDRWHAARAKLRGYSKRDPNKGGGAP